MRRSFIAVATAALCIYACSAFDTDGENQSPAQDAGIDRAPVQQDSSTTSPSDSLGEITYDREDNFERDPLPGAGPLNWAEVNAAGGASDPGEVIQVGECSGDAHCSPTNAVHISANTSGAGYLTTDLDEHTRNVRFDFSMTIIPVPLQADGQVRVASIELAEGGTIFLQILGTELQLGEHPSAKDAASVTVDLGTMSFDSWARYRLYVNLDEHVAAVARDGKSFATTLTIPPDVGNALKHARLGISLAKNSAYEALYDDVGIRELPKP